MDFNKKELYTAKRSSGIDVEDPNIQLTWNKLRNNEINWLLLHLVSATVCGVKSSGHGGVDEFISNLNSDEILFGAIRADINNQIKFYHIYYVGENVSAIKKGKASMFESKVFQALEGAHGKIQFTCSAEEMTKDTILQQLHILTKSDHINI